MLMMMVDGLMVVVVDDDDGSVGLGLLELGLELGVALLDLGEALQEDRDPVRVARALLLQIVQGLPRLCCVRQSVSQAKDTASVCRACCVRRVSRVSCVSWWRRGQVPHLVR